MRNLKGQLMKNRTEKCDYHIYFKLFCTKVIFTKCILVYYYLFIRIATTCSIFRNGLSYPVALQEWKQSIFLAPPQGAQFTQWDLTILPNQSRSLRGC